MQPQPVRRSTRAAALALLIPCSAMLGCALHGPAVRRAAASVLLGGFDGAVHPVVVQSVVPRTSVIVPVCDKLGCYQMNACIDRWDFRTEHGGCEVYSDWTQRMGYCEDDRDAFGVTAALACPVACDSCALGACFIPATNEIMSCDGAGQDNAVFSDWEGNAVFDERSVGDIDDR